MHIEQEARDLLNAVSQERHGCSTFDPIDSRINYRSAEAVCRALEAHNETQAAFDAFRREVSEAIRNLPNRSAALDRFIIPEPVDPLTATFPATMKVILYHESGGHEGDGSDHALQQARDELAKIGGKVVFDGGRRMTDLHTRIAELAEKATPRDWELCFYDAGDREYYDHNGPCPSIQAPESEDCAVVHWDGFKQQYWSSANGNQRQIEVNATLIVTLRNDVPEILTALRIAERVMDEDWLAAEIADTTKRCWPSQLAARAIIAALKEPTCPTKNSPP